MHRLCALILLIMIAAGAACDRKKATPIFIPPPKEEGPSYEVELQPVTPLAAARLTHIAVDSLGNLCWVQESDQADDTMFIMGEDKVPHAADLSTTRVCEALGISGGTGNIQSLAPARGGDLFFYFLGSKGRQTLACLGLYSNKSGRIRVLADTNTLMAETGLGRSITLARGTVVSHGNSYWLWVRHTDASALHRLRAVDIPSSGYIALESGRLNVRIEGHTVDLTNPEYAISAAGEESLFWLDRTESMLYRIDANGYVSLYKSLVGLPLALSLPSRDPQGRILIFAADSPKSEVTNLNQINLPRVRVTVPFPALLMFDQNALRAIGSDKFHLYPGVSLQAMRIGELISDPKDRSWLGYDNNSGELIRMRISERE
jgi:hypothetical protein